MCRSRNVDRRPLDRQVGAHGGTHAHRRPKPARATRPAAEPNGQRMARVSLTMARIVMRARPIPARRHDTWCGQRGLRRERTWARCSRTAPLTEAQRPTNTSGGGVTATRCRGTIRIATGADRSKKETAEPQRHCAPTSEVTGAPPPLPGRRSRLPARPVDRGVGRRSSRCVKRQTPGMTLRF